MPKAARDNQPAATILIKLRYSPSEAAEKTLVKILERPANYTVRCLTSSLF